jgi:RhoGAP domain
MPCVPMAQTPSSKGFVGTVADFAPNTSPMIPALVIHCVNEIERRGMNEVGIYRVSGSEREVKDMKVLLLLVTCLNVMLDCLFVLSIRNDCCAANGSLKSPKWTSTSLRAL